MNFTVMLTQEQTVFIINYINPGSHTLRYYYHDFIVIDEDRTYVIVEVKGDHQIDNSIVQAKAKDAQQMTIDNGIMYKMVKGSEAKNNLIF